MKSLAVILFGRMLIVLVGIVQIKAITTWLSPSEVGRFYIISSLLAWAPAVFIHPLTIFMERHLLEWNPLGCAWKNYRSYLIYCFFFALISIPFFLIIEYFFGLGVTISPWFLALMILVTPLCGDVAGTINVGFNILGNRLSYVFFSSGGACLSIAVAVIFAGCIASNAELWIAGLTSAKVIVTLFALYFFWKILKKEKNFLFQKLDYKKIFEFSWPMMLTTGFGWLNSQGYRFALNAASGAEFVGVFGAAYSVGAGFMSIFETLFNQYYAPFLYKGIASEKKEERELALNLYAERFISTLIPVVVFIVFGAPYILKYMTGSKFHGAVDVVVWSVFIESVRFINSLYYISGLSEKNMKILILPSMINGFAVLPLVYLFAKISPFHGTGAGLLISFLCYSAAVRFSSRETVFLKSSFKKLLKSCILSSPLLIWAAIGVFIGSSSFLFATLMLLSGGLFMIFIEFILLKDWAFKMEL